MKFNSLNPIRFTSEAIYINETPRILLCASLFYFRLPRAVWKDRLRKVKKAGYTCIDVYFPWNHHELHYNEWHFSGERDVEVFLRDVKEEGLLVVARPGPYICSEWDGGAIPAYLFAEENIQLRDNDPVYLRHVERWFEKIMPILSEYQYGRNGTIICIQLENELDFYNCTDPLGYISALRDMADRYDFDVPYIACAGQGDLFRASGHAKGVVPTCNFYPHDKDPQFEAKVHEYVTELESRHLPLLVTETNRSHYLLRRLLSVGAKLLGPYNQVSGTDFGFTTAVNNWGNPLAFMTTDYDFQGMISPEGHLRPEVREGRLLSRIITTYGDALAEAVPLADHGITWIKHDKSLTILPSALRLKGGGLLLSVLNVGEHSDEVVIHYEGLSIPSLTELTIMKDSCVLLPLQVPLRLWGMTGTLEYSTAELGYVKKLHDRQIMLLHSESEAEVAFHWDTPIAIHIQGCTYTEEEGQYVFTFKQESSASVQLANGQQLQIMVIERSKALLLEEIDEMGDLSFEVLWNLYGIESSIDNWKLNRLRGSISMSDETVSLGNKADYLEKHGVLRGFSWYKTIINDLKGKSCEGVLLLNASDVISLYNQKSYLGTVVPGGGHTYVPSTILLNETELELSSRVEIWGHSNFDDSRLPSLKMNAMKGMTELIAVTNKYNIGSNWRFRPSDNNENSSLFVSPGVDQQTWPIIGWGSWSTIKQPSFGYYRKSITRSDYANAWVLHFPNVESIVTVYIGGNPVGKVNPLSPYVDITPFVDADLTIEITLFLERFYGQSVGDVIMLEGIRANDWTLSNCEEMELWEHSTASLSAAVTTKIPVIMQPGETAWLYAEELQATSPEGMRMFIKGRNIKLTVFLNGIIVGRIWTSDSSVRPQFSGGHQQSVYLPGAWMKEQSSRLAILLEAVEFGELSTLEQIDFKTI